MGISGLLPLLKSIHKPCHLKKFAGQTIGVDAYGWLHRGTVACAVELALGKPTRKHIEFSMHRVRMLLHFGIIPYLVFDGDYLPSKANIEAERAKRREESKNKGLELYRLNKPSQAHLEFQKAIDVTPEMARELIEELKKIGVQYVVAPYEADAQLVYLERQGIIQGMLSEDSDLLVFGAKRLLTKLDQYGECVEVNRKDFTACRAISLVGWTDAEFRRMAILSGCDYLANINRMGLKSAYRIVRKYKTTDKIVRMLHFEGQLHVPTGYLEDFKKAELTFLYQWVFCPLDNQIVPMSEPEDGIDPCQLPFIGDKPDQSVAIGISKGDLDPMTKAPILLSTKAVTASPKTPWAKSKEVVAQVSSGKENKSIEQFFKPARVPLAELDPNSFTPSPTQQQLLQRATGSFWNSRPALPDTPTQRGSLSFVEQTINRSGADTTHNGAVAVSGISKKRRFDVETPAKGPLHGPREIQGTRSKFFAASGAQATPIRKEKGKGGRKRNTDFSVWSDDSTEDAMAELADNIMTSRQSQGTQDSNKDETVLQPRKRTAKPTEEQASQTLTQSSVVTRDMSDSQLSGSTAATSLSRSTSLISKTLDQNVISKVCESSQSQTGNMEEAVSQVEDQSRESLDGAQGPLRSKPKLTLPRSASMSALQTLGARALNRSTSSTTPLNNFKRSTATAESSLSKRFSFEERPPTDKPFRPSLPVSYSIGPDASMVKGSEDAMIPDSQESDEGRSEAANESISEVEDTPPRKSVGLGRFAFAG